MYLELALAAATYSLDVASLLLKQPLSLTGINTAGEHAPEAEAVPIPTWQGPVEVTRSARIPVSAFAEQLLSEPEHEPESMSSASNSSACAHTVCGVTQGELHPDPA